MVSKASRTQPVTPPGVASELCQTSENAKKRKSNFGGYAFHALTRVNRGKKQAGAATHRLRPTWCEIPAVVIPEKRGCCDCCCAPPGSIKIQAE
jgi:hypothetical protein